MEKFLLIEKTLGYVTKPDPTNTNPHYLVSPSQNVLINDDEKVETRGGYSLFGAASATTNAIESAYDWEKEEVAGAPADPCDRVRTGHDTKSG